MSTPGKRIYRRRKGLPTWRIVRYADDFVVLVHGNHDDVHACAKRSVTFSPQDAL